MRYLATVLALLLSACSLSPGPGRATPGGAILSTSAIDDGAAIEHSAVAGSPPTSGTPWFLTIGDSITAGYSRDPARHDTNAGWPVQLEALLARTQRPWHLYDVACQGETTETYRSRCSGRATIPFLEHISQHDAATNAISAHLSDLQLIVVDLGSNDLLLSQLHGTSLPDAISGIRSRLDSILSELRRMAPRVPLLVANFYDPFENGSPETLGEVSAANSAVLDVARRNDAVPVDVFSAINTRSAPAPTLCVYLDCTHYDPMHPTVAGHARIGATMLAAIPS